MQKGKKPNKSRDKKSKLQKSPSDFRSSNSDPSGNSISRFGPLELDKSDSKSMASEYDYIKKLVSGEEHQMPLPVAEPLTQKYKPNQIELKESDRSSFIEYKM